MIRSAALSLLVVCFSVADAHAGTATGTRVEIDAAKRELRVVQDDHALMVFNPVSIGRWGATASKKRGDGKTPLGEFRIVWFQPDGQFGPFLGIDYPSVERAQKGFANGEINAAEFEAILQAHTAGHIPPQNTALGGDIGIHGLGRADPDIHHDVNWTRGCVAVTDEQMQRLLEVVGIGTIVRIR